LIDKSPDHTNLKTAIN